MDGNATLTRRQFIVTAATAAGGLAIGLATGPSPFAAMAGAQPWSSEDGHNPHDLDAFIAIEPESCGTTPFDVSPIAEFFAERLDDLRRLLVHQSISGSPYRSARRCPA